MNILRSQPIKIALGIIIGLGVIILIALAIDANGNRNSLSQSDAQNIALKEAGVNKDQVTSLDVTDKNTFYTVTFVADGKAYSYDVNKSGDVIRASFAMDDTNTAITKEDAQTIALNDAGINADACDYLNVHEDRDDGRDVYDVEFYSGGVEYDYEISKDGKITQKDYDIENYKPNTDNSQTPTTSPVTADKTREEAQAIALKDAGVSEADCVYLVTNEDYDDGYSHYDVEFFSGGVEYDYEVSKDGRILKKDYDIENYKPQANSNTTNSDVISYDKAKEIALSRVEGATDQNIRIEFDHDDGYPYYDGEIYYNGMEYEFEIDGYTGNIIEWSADRD